MSSGDPSISASNFARLRELIYSEAGICLGPEQKIMLESRVKRRLKALNLTSYAEYCDYLFGRKGLKEEIVHLIDVVTTNKTDFFREPRHFNFLVEKARPEFVSRYGNSRRFLVWSAGCSSGEEPYTLAILLSEFALVRPGFRFRILATDISNTVLGKAELGVYSSEVVASVPAALRRKYFLRSRNHDSNRLRVAPELRQLVDFRRLNFMDSGYGLSEKADAVFCRNVIIYFDRPTQESILRKLSVHLHPDGYMFVGHSETLHDMDLPLAPVAPALYRRIDAGV
jgi:chemotaxis protein methyltransferase CheR